MSTTLKALQRIDEQRERSSAQRSLATFRVEGPIAMTGKASKWKLRDWRWPPKSVVVVFLTLLFALSAVLYISHRPAKTPSPASYPFFSSGKVSAMPPPAMEQENPQPNRVTATDPLPPLPAPAGGFGTAVDNTPTAAAAPRSAEVKPWHGDEIRVQAIVYGPDTSERMAMINQRMVRQGDMVKGFVVVAIEEDAVLVRRAGDLWRARLGR